MNNQRMIKPCGKAVLSNIGLIPANIEMHDMLFSQFSGYDPSRYCSVPDFRNEYLGEFVTTPETSGSPAPYGNDMVDAVVNNLATFFTWDTTSSAGINVPLYMPASIS
jgi:hypothetical protein